MSGGRSGPVRAAIQSIGIVTDRVKGGPPRTRVRPALPRGKSARAGPSRLARIGAALRVRAAPRSLPGEGGSPQRQGNGRRSQPIEDSHPAERRLTAASLRSPSIPTPTDIATRPGPANPERASTRKRGPSAISGPDPHPSQVSESTGGPRQSLEDAESHTAGTSPPARCTASSQASERCHVLSVTRTG